MNKNGIELLKLAGNTIRILSAEGVEKANSGHPGLPMGMADVAAVLWTEFLKHNPEDPKWINRDRFVLSAGHGSMLLYSMLHLSGYDCTIEDLKSFRQWNSRTPGHPEYGMLDGVETSTGPLGQGLSNGIGMAIAAKMMNARFDDNLIGNHFIYGIMSDGDLMEGISHESCSLAGHLGLGNIIYFYDDNNITIEGNTSLTFSDNTAMRFEAYGWQVLNITAYDYNAIREAIVEGQKETLKPTIIITKSHIGFGSPNKVDTSGVHGSPLGKEELEITKKYLDWDLDKEFYVPDKVAKLFADRKEELHKEYNEWKNDFTGWSKKNPDQFELLEKYLTGWVPENLEEELLKAAPKEPAASRTLSSKVIQKIAELVPSFIGGSADLAPSTNTYMKGYSALSKDDFAGKNFHFGIREHAMGAIVSGLVLYGGFKVFGSTFFVFSDYMRPAIRLASIMELPVIYVFTHDSIFVGEDGPTHEPVEHLAVLRAIPHVTVFRPADGEETAMAWSYALRNTKNPVALILTRQKIEAFEKDTNLSTNEILKGAYIVSKEKSDKPDFVIAASGSEVPLAADAKKLLENDFNIRVISIPSKEVFEKQSDEFKNSLFPSDTPVVIIEAASMMGWGDLFRQKLLRIGIEHFGASAPYKTLAKEYGFTGESVANKIKEWIK